MTLILGLLVGFTLSIGLVIVAKRRMAQQNQPKALLQELPPELAGRYLELVSARDRVRQTVQSHGLQAVMGDQLRQLEAMVETYLRLAQEAGRYRAYLLTTPPGAIEKEIERTSLRLDATENPDARATITQNIAVLSKRLEKVQQIRDVATSLKVRLDALENAVRLVQEQAMTASAPEDIQLDFDGVMADVAAADRALAETRAYVVGQGLGR